jgi:hypothetical protein
MIATESQALAPASHKDASGFLFSVLRRGFSGRISPGDDGRRGLPCYGENAMTDMMPDRTRRCLGIALFACALSVIGAVVAMWPIAGTDQSVTVFCGMRAMPREANLLALVLLFGALGSFVHVAKSFASFAGNRALAASWLWWYLLQPVAGMALALLFYAGVRGGLFAPGSYSGAVNPYGVAGVSGLVGMFSRQATDKLGEVFGAMFQTAADAQRKDKLFPPQA